MDKISPTKWKWLKQEDAAQCEKVFEYLSNRKLIIRTAGIPNYQAITSLFESWPNDAEHREKLKQTHGAWKTHKAREAQVDSKQYNFTLPIRVRKHLDALAKKRGLTINKTLEALIEESYGPSKTAKPKAAIKAEKANNTPSQSSAINENESGLVDIKAEEINSSPLNDNSLTENWTELTDIEGEKTNNPPLQDHPMIEDESSLGDIKAEETDTPVESATQDNLQHSTPEISEHGNYEEQTTQNRPKYAEYKGQAMENPPMDDGAIYSEDGKIVSRTVQITRKFY